MDSDAVALLFRSRRPCCLLLLASGATDAAFLVGGEEEVVDDDVHDVEDEVEVDLLGGEHEDEVCPQKVGGDANHLQVL